VKSLIATDSETEGQPSISIYDAFDMMPFLVAHEQRLAAPQNCKNVCLPLFAEMAAVSGTN
jgi:hypothetical protein